jgi:hypothetical protein
MTFKAPTKPVKALNHIQKYLGITFGHPVGPDGGTHTKPGGDERPLIQKKKAPAQFGVRSELGLASALWEGRRENLAMQPTFLMLC